MKMLSSNLEIQMNSLEIANMLQARHDKVKQSIKRLAAKGVIQLPPMGIVENNQSLSANNKVSVHVFSGEQGKRDSYIVVAQMSPEFTAVIVDRWRELEESVVSRLPDFTNPVEAARAWADELEAKLLVQSKLDEAKPAIEYYEDIVNKDGLISMGDFAKQLGVGRNKMFEMLRGMKILQAEQSKNAPYQQYVRSGYFEVKQTVKNDRVYSVTLVTPKGLKWLHSKIKNT